MQKALLATKLKEFNDHVVHLPIGGSYQYKTTKKAIVFKLNPSDEVWLRVQGDGEVKAKFIVENVVRGSHIMLRLSFTCSISTKWIFDTYKIKAGAEHGWIKR